MRFLLCLSTLLVLGNPLAAAEPTPPNTLSISEKMAGWELLFDGKTTDGWRNYKQDDVSDGWVIEDGALIRKDNGAGDIITKDQYEHFELMLDYKISPEGNSGLMFHVQETEQRPWQTGPEVQIQDNVDGHDPQKAGWLYQLYQPSKPRWAQKAEAEYNLPQYLDATRPAGEWNQIYLRISPQQCEVDMNGVRYYTFKKGSADWNKRVANSKFSKFENFGKPTKGHLCLQDHGDLVAFRNIKIRKLTGDTEAIDPVDGQLNLKPVAAFPNLKWKGWSPVTDDGKINKFRPLTLTHAGDGSDRIFVATQEGVIHVFENDPEAEQETEIFLDLTDKVAPYRKANEEGLLGLAFHPDYKNNGQFFVYYSSLLEPRVSIISRFTVSDDNPNKADADSEFIVMRIEQPFSNHNGGSIEFGPDGYLYVGLGDGGSADDPFGNGQNLETLLGSILRIDVDEQQDGKNYAIPEDNPFVETPNAQPEIFAYGLRNTWRLGFDAKTGWLWAADVGQNLWEEINIIQKGGNYGWSVRESAHIFGSNGVEANAGMIDPLWEYDHQVGKSITGGYVYRGTRLPEHQGTYFYADYVTSRHWGLKYDHQNNQVLGNYAIPGESLQPLAYGQDENLELYFTTETLDGKGIYKYVPTN